MKYLVEPHVIEELLNEINEELEKLEEKLIEKVSHAAESENIRINAHITQIQDALEAVLELPQLPNYRIGYMERESFSVS
ncbi:hypothetical protein [Metabacillus sp. RGM 3146]|uniref:hypothetical protein n=1 Tax=Metabacillus sp. RGM 3146 TaxID=3401092 RepID=UPI003B99381F